MVPARRVLVITPFPPSLSPEADYGLRLSERLCERGLEVHVLTIRGGIGSTRPKLIVHSPIRDWSWGALPLIAATAARLQPDAVLLCYVNWVFGFHPMITFAPTWLKAVLPRTPVVSLMHNADTYPLEWSPSRRHARTAVELCAGKDGLDPLYGSLFRDSDRVFAAGESVRAQILGRAPGAAGRCEALGVPPILEMSRDEPAVREAARAELGIAASEFVLGNFGFVYGGKGIESLLEAFGKLLQKRGRDRLRLLMIGGVLESWHLDNFYRSMQQRARALGLGDRVLWSGSWNWDSDRGSRLLRATDACALPFDLGASTQHCSISTVLAHGLPLVTTAGEFTAPHFVDQENALLVPPRDAGAIVRAVESLLDDPALRTRLSDGAAALNRRCFSWEPLLDRLLLAFAR